ncbi:bifunctional glutamate/proline--tRNA ligase isoform X1 [Hydra vulgaris]|uniref:bifunctional glutamate/proline--tRNA ligase isoform X1 n=1 Tax=Hydra vulgaris TaxID=6087 RepID=UPI001F5E3969|nr:bifunctional glutamate/proline--tRNA ligase-like isoform X1 [Hydra vulgaris]
MNLTSPGVYRVFSQNIKRFLPVFSTSSRKLLLNRYYLFMREMSITVNVDVKNYPTVSLLTVAHLQENGIKVTLVEGNSTFVKLSNSSIEGDTSVAKYLARLYPNENLYGSSVLEKSQVDSWIDFSHLYLRSPEGINDPLNELNKCLEPATHLVGHSFTLADFAVWASLKGNSTWESMFKKRYLHVLRWFEYCSNQKIFKFVMDNKTKNPTSIENVKDVKKATGLKTTMEEGGKFFDLPGAEKGKVVVRFPPEASGYLHIGHAKAALMNQYYKELYDGKLIMRFDDTNPAKENAHFEEIILEDIKLLQLTPDHYSRTSDHFDVMLKYADQMIKQGDAYCDNTVAEEVKRLREERLPSPNRNLSIDENLELFKEMIAGSEKGLTYCLRAKIDYKSDNGCLRDPVMYRCRTEEHLVHGNKYVVYPTYDFACPIVDSLEGVTHALRTSEYLDRDSQYYWFIDKLGLRKPYIYSYSRLALVNTVLSKRKLTYLVDEGFVDGWDDPRFPTVRGILRRGMSVQGLKEFIVAQGSSKSNVHMEWDKIWAFNKKVIDPIAPRFNALLKSDVVPVIVNGATESSAEYPKHPKNDEVGKKQVYYSSKVYIEGEDANLMKENELVTFINWGNLRITKVNKEGEKVKSIEANLELENKDFKKTAKITWLAEHSKAPFIPTQCLFFDNIIDKDLTRDDDFKEHISKNTKHVYEMMGDPCLSTIKKGDIIQLQRRGFFICDEPYQSASCHSGLETPCKLFHIPDGSSSGMMNQGKDKANASSSSSREKSSSSKKQVKQEPKEQKTLVNKENQLKEQTSQALFDSVTAQGEKIRKLKSDKASKETITAEVNILKDLKAKYKELTGVEYTNDASVVAKPTTVAKPTVTKPAVKTESTKQDSSNTHQSLYNSISAQGDRIRNLKSEKASKEVIGAEVNILKELKNKYKTLTGIDYPALSQPADLQMAPTSSPTIVHASSSDDMTKKIYDQGEKIRLLKSAKTSKDVLQPEIDILLKLKAEYKVLTGSDYKPQGEVKHTEDKKKVEKPKEKVEVKQEDGKKQSRLGLEATKEESLSDWYSQVITKSELIEYYDVSGCYILRPWAYGIWETIKEFFDQKIKASGVENCYFPMFVSQAALEKEKDHIQDFAPEVAWVTKSGQSELAEPIAIRPTSETVMYPSYAKWIQSYRDLPLRMNQWCNVVRWEFKHPQPFLRTREFLWQEGHTAYANKEEACEEVLEILGYYEQVYTELLAIPVVKGRKTEKEKFAGGDFTTTCEAFISASGRAIQGATSHHLGQNFSKMFNIVIEDPKNPESKEKLFIYQNSWGLTTRSIGVMVMVHGDNKGLVLPPRVANIQVIIVPVGVTASTTAEKRQEIYDYCNNYEAILKKAGIRVKLDARDNYSPGWKFNHWELKGVPIRIELGPRDIEKNELVAVRRDTGEKISMKQEGCSDEISSLLERIQSDMLARATDQLNSALTVTKSWEEFNSNLDKNKLIQAPFCGGIKCEELIKKESAREDNADSGAPSMGAKSLCIPFKQPAIVTDEKCIHPGCNQPAVSYTLFGRSY